MTKVEYSSNNSGGDWWLSDEDWYALERAGWDVDWCKNRPKNRLDSDGERWLGALATSASREGLSLGAAIREWESVTGQNSTDLGCGCCGSPHYFSSDDGNSYSADSYTYVEPYDGP